MKDSEAVAAAMKPSMGRSRKGKGGAENALCKYRGIRQRTWGKWVSEVREPNRGTTGLWLGTFNSSYEAAVAYNEAAKKLYGSSVKLNLPNNGVSSITTSANFVSADNGEIIVGSCGSFSGRVQDQNGGYTSGSSGSIKCEDNIGEFWESSFFGLVDGGDLCWS